MYERHVGEMVVHYLNGGRWWGTLETPGSTIDPEVLRRANFAFREALGDLIDQLIHTGIDDQGVENPSNRRVRAAAGDAPISLFDTLLGWLGRNMPHPALMNDGTIAIVEQRPMHYGKDPEDYAREMAIYYLHEVLGSPARTRIAQCKNPQCRRYFERKRERRTAIKRGSYCGNCRLVGNAERTKLSRARKKHQLLKVAAEAWIRWEQAHIRADRAKWVAVQVNRKYPREAPIQAKWVNQNKRQILDLVRT